MSPAYIDEGIKLAAPDGKFIYGDLIKASKPNSSLIIYAHGMTSTRADYIYLNSARLFARKGYDSLRFSFYSWEEGARCLTQCNIQTHRRDLETVIKKFRNKYERIYLIGHSWGGLTIMHGAWPSVAAISLWDPSYAPKQYWPNFIGHIKGIALLQGGTDTVLSPLMLKQALALDFEACRKLSTRFAQPLQVLHAKKNGMLYKFGESYHTSAKGPTDYHLLAEADHSFQAEAAQTKAVEMTDKWFRKFR
jgi:pimeloyl-ACP methyl ester carboxylesterase